MPAAKLWKSDECEAAAKAYVIATHDEVSGAQQKSMDFGKKIHSAFNTCSPPETGKQKVSTYTQYSFVPIPNND
jgi:hypothetical protein